MSVVIFCRRPQETEKRRQNDHSEEANPQTTGSKRHRVDRQRRPDPPRWAHLESFLNVAVVVDDLRGSGVSFVSGGALQRGSVSRSQASNGCCCWPLVAAPQNYNKQDK